MKTINEYGRIINDAILSVKLLGRFDRRFMSIAAAKKAGLSIEDVKKAVDKRRARERNKLSDIDTFTHKRRALFLKLVKEATFDMNITSSRYNCTGIDWKAFHRPSSSGGWVLIAPDEPMNNWHTNDPILVKYLSSKYLNKN